MGGLQEETSRRLPGSQDFRAWIFLLASHGTQVAWHDFRAKIFSLGKGMGQFYFGGVDHKIFSELARQ